MNYSEYVHALDFARGYMFIFQNEKGDVNLIIKKGTPAEIRKKIDEVWPIVRDETYRRHERCEYTSNDYFM